MVRFGAHFLVCIVLLATTTSASRPSDEIATKVQAAMVVRFVKYVRWPKKRHAAPESPIVIGVLDDADMFAAVKTEAKGAKSGKRPLEIISLTSPQNGKPLDEWKKCHILCVPSSSKIQVKLLIEFAHQNSVLTVSDRSGFVKEKGVIEFVVVDKKMKFRVSQDAAKASTLRLSSKLLKLGLKE